MRAPGAIGEPEEDDLHTLFCSQMGCLTLCSPSSHRDLLSVCCPSILTRGTDPYVRSSVRGGGTILKFTLLFVVYVLSLHLWYGSLSQPDSWLGSPQWIA